MAVATNTCLDGDGFCWLAYDFYSNESVALGGCEIRLLLLFSSAVLP